MANISIDYEILSIKAKSLGLTWTFNSIEGLKFAVEFFEREEKLKTQHSFDYNRKCINCNVDKYILSLVNSTSDFYNCKICTFIRNKYNADINNLIKNETNIFK